MISVIIPIYNVAPFLNQCVESIVNQTYRDLEIILVDDGSTDGSEYICDEWAKKDSRIKVIHKENEGVSEARNVGIRESTGKYISFVDSDDFVDQEFLQYLYSLIKNNNADIAITKFTNINSNGNIIEQNNNSKIDDTTLKKGGYEGLKAYFENDGIEVFVWGRLYKKDLFNNLLFPKGKMNEDVFINYQLIDKSKLIIIGNKPLYFYRIRQDSLMHRDFQIKHLDTLIGRELQQKFIVKNYPNLIKESAFQIIKDTLRCYWLIQNSHKKNLKYYVLIYPYLKKYGKFTLLNKFTLKEKLYILMVYCKLNIYNILYSFGFK